jgi:endonuclease/exonuclease/phosphatase family metal-dependent hydrolase
VSFVIHQELDFGQTIAFSGSTTYTAPNGDQLYTTHTGIATPTPDGLGVTLAGTETAAGGTGRFAGASGSAAITGTSFLAGPNAGTGSYDLLGTISFDQRGRGGELTVMTYNIYQGTELQNAIAAKTGGEFVVGAAKDFLMMRQTKFAERARALAAEIAEAQPDVVGLQEVALWRTGVHTTPAQPATTIDQDFLQLLLDALAQTGRPYTVASSVEDFDVQAPALLSASGLTDVRLTDRDAILVRADASADRVKVFNPQSGNYATNLVINTVGGPVVVREGWASIDVTRGSRTVRFVTTHLDASAAPIRLAQATELLSGPGNTELPVIVAGDMNTTTVTDTYAAFTGAGFADVWGQLHPTDDGFTCCEAPALDNPLPWLSKRIDLVFLRGNVEPMGIARVGAEPGTRTISGLWPSDHAGLVATIQIEHPR